MTENLNAEIIAIGTEILLGEIVDTNSVYIARSLRDIGVNLYFMTSVGDNERRIADAIRIALSRAQVVITCGGLGPTVDDMTRQAVAMATDRELTFHQELLDEIAARFATFRSQMTDNNKRQAFLPDNAIAIHNPVGTAPSFIVEHNGGVVISLPGVPREMKFLMVDKVLPYLHERYQLGIIKAHVLHTAGIGESMLDDAIGTELLEQSNPTIGLAAHSGQVDVRITAKADSVEEADQMIAQVEAQLRARIGANIYGVNDETLEQALVSLLKERGLAMALSETGIGAYVNDQVSKVPQGKEILTLVESFTNPDELRAALGLPEKATLKELAQAAVERVCEQSGAMACIAVVSLPDNNEAADSEEGTAVVAYVGGQSRSRVYGFGGRSETVRPWVSMWTLSMVWRMLKEQADVESVR